MRANSASTLGSPVRFIGILNLNRTDASTAQLESSAGNLILPHRMADHRIDIDAVEDPVQLLGRKRDDRLLAARPSELVLGQPLQDQHEAGPIEEQQLYPVATAIAERKNHRRKRIERHRLLDQNRKAVDASPEVDRLTVQIDLQVTAQSEHGSVLR
ncbi:hypothetical protein [Bradyrhizobium sp. I1.14.4]|uniref:hypothetical protein n=1 Tax=unclassified Bradyrhizobium TaxID=2631580 RepID=UPI003D200A2A